MVEEKAIEILRKYYNAMNEQNSLNAIFFLREDVIVIFPENERNWNGKTLAKEKFEGMFKKMPGFHGEFDVISVKVFDSSQVAEIETNCRFFSSISNEVSTRDMKYTIDIITEKILQIVHL